jgi:hydrogenase expression/formation protein HypD
MQMTTGMKYIEEYRDKNLILKLADHINREASGSYSFMEVCGGHTSAIHRFGIPSLLPESVNLISGPGCPVCVTSTEFIDRAIIYSRMENAIIATFGDLIRVPGSNSSLEKERSTGADIRVIFSGLEAINIARSNPDKMVIFLGIGFETTAPGTAITVLQARIEKLTNFMLLSSHKVMPPVMEALVTEEMNLNGFICPGHVASITGSRIFNFLPARYGLGCVVTGFEPTDLLQSILMLVKQININSPEVEIQYKRVVTPDGNIIAQKHLSEVFDLCDAEWRGFGIIASSGLCLKDEFDDFSAERRIPVTVNASKDNPACICSEILRGRKIPVDCTLFRKACSPENPIGACMVSPEGACNTFFRYHK